MDLISLYIDKPSDSGCIGFALRIWRFTLSLTWRLKAADEKW